MPVPYPAPLDTDSELLALRRYASAYQNWRALYEMVIHNEVMLLSPNYTIIVARLVQLGVKARDDYHQACLDVFTGIPLDRWEDIGK